jgi:cold shock CspA family protein
MLTTLTTFGFCFCGGVVLLDAGYGGAPMRNSGGYRIPDGAPGMSLGVPGPDDKPFERQKGTVTSWDQRGFGFVTPASNPAGGDLFVHYSDIADGNCLIAGKPVEFVKQFKAKKGKWNAVEVTGGSMDGGKDDDMNTAKAKAKTPVLAVASMHVPGKIAGVVVSWVKDKGYGFCQPFTGGEPLFIHYSEVMDGNCLKPGAQVMFVKELNLRKGKHFARTLTGGCFEAPPGFEPPADPTAESAETADAPEDGEAAKTKEEGEGEGEGEEKVVEGEGKGESEAGETGATATVAAVAAAPGKANATAITAAPDIIASAISAAPDIIASAGKEAAVETKPTLDGAEAVAPTPTTTATAATDEDAVPPEAAADGDGSA